MGTILDRSGYVCLRLGGACFRAQEWIAPAPPDLAPPTADRILAGISARLTVDAAGSPQLTDVQPFNPAAWQAQKPTVLLPWQGTH